MKTKEELKSLKEEVETLNKKLVELTEEELAQVTGGGATQKPVSADNTDCRYGYIPIDASKPQSRGNCYGYNQRKSVCCYTFG